MPRPATGSVVRTKDGRWRARITLANGDQVRLKPFPEGTTEKRARERSAVLADRARREGWTKPPAPDDPASRQGETVEQWAERWVKDRKAKGLSAAQDDESRIKTHILPASRNAAMAGVSREQIEDFVQYLDSRVRNKKMSWRTAAHIWGVLSKMFVDAQRSKLRALRVRKDNPTADVLGPDRGAAKSKVYLYPSEFLKLVS